MYPYRKRLPSVRNESSVDRGDTDQIPYESYSNTTSKSKNCKDNQDIVVNGSITRLVGFVKESIYNVTSVNTSHDVYGSRESSVDVASDSCVDPVTKNAKLSKLKGCVESFVGDNNNISNNKNDVYAEEKQRTNTKERYGTSYTNVTQTMPYYSVKTSNRLRSKSQKKESKPSKVLRKQTKGLDLNRPVGRLDSQHLSKVAHTAIESRLLSKGRVPNAPHVLPNRVRSSDPHEHSLKGENREDPESNITSSNSLSEANSILEQGSSVDTLSEFARQRSISCQNTLFPPETMSYCPRPRSEQISRLENSRKKRYEPLPKKDQSHAIIKKLAPAILTPILDTKEIHIREVLTKKASVQQKNILRNPNKNRSVKAKKIKSPQAGAHVDSSPVIEKPTNVLVLSEKEYVRLAIQKRKPKFQAKKNIYDYDQPDSDGEHVANDLKTAQLGFEECLKCVPQWEDPATSQMPGKNESQYEQSPGLAGEEEEKEIDLYLLSNDSSCDQNKQTELKRMKKKKKKKRDKKKNSGNPKLGGPALTGRSSIDPAVTSSSLSSDSSENESTNRSRIRKKTSKRSKDSARRWPDPSSFGDTKTDIKGVENVPKSNRKFTDDVPRLYRECTGNVPKMYRECTENVPVEMSGCSEQDGGGEDTHGGGYQFIFQEPLSSCFPPTAMSCDVGTRSKQTVRLGKGGTCQNLTTPKGMLKRSEIFTHDIFDKGTSRKDILQQMNSLLRKNNQNDQNNQVKMRSPASRNFSPRTNVLQESPLAQIVQEQAGQPDGEPTQTVCNGLAPFESEAERRAIQRRGKNRKRKTKKVYKKDQNNYKSKLRGYRNRIAPREDKRPEGLDYMNTATQGLESCLKTLLSDCGDERPNYETTTSDKSLQSKTDECDARSNNASKGHRFDQIESNKVDVKSIQSPESSDSAKEMPPTFRRDNAMKSPPAPRRMEKYPSKKRILSCKHVTIPTYPSGLPILDIESVPEKHLSKTILMRSPVIKDSSITSEEEKSKYSITSKDENRKGGIILEEEKRKCDITSEEDKSKDSITSEEETRKSEIISEDEKGKCDITSEEAKSKDSITSEEENHKGGIVSEEEKRKRGIISEGAKRKCIISPKPFIVSTNSMLEEKLILDADSLSECARKKSLSSQPPSIFNKSFFPPENMSYDIGSRSEQIAKIEAGRTRRYNPLPKKENTPVVTKVTPNHQNKDYHRIFNKGSKQGSVQLKNFVLNKHNQQHINNKAVPRNLSPERYGPPVFNILNDLNNPMHISAAKSSSSDEHQELDYFKPINGLVPSESQYKRLSIQKRKKKKMRADLIRKMSSKKIYNFDQQPSDLGEKLENKLECKADNPESANNMPKDDSEEPQKKDTAASKISTDNITHIDTGSRQTCSANLYNKEDTGYKKTIERAENADRSVNNIHSSNIENQSDKGLRSTAKESHGISSEVETPKTITPHQGLGVTGKIYEYLTKALNVTRINFNKEDKEKTTNEQQPRPVDAKAAAASEPNLPVIDQSDVCQESEEHKEDKEPSAEHFGYSETKAVRADNITKTLLDKRNPQSRSVPVPVDIRNVLNPSPPPMPLPRNRHPASRSSNASVTYNRKCVLSPKQSDSIKSPTRISESLCDIITELRSINSNLDDVLRNEESCERATNYSNDKDLGSQVKHTISELLTHIDGQTVDQPTLEKTTKRKYKANAKVNTDSGGEFSTDTSMGAVSFETVTRKLNESLSDQKLSKGFYDDNDDFDDMDDIFDENDPYGVDSDSSSSPFSHVYEGLISLEDLKIKQPNNRSGSDSRDQGEMSCDMSPDPAMDVKQRRWQIIKQSSPLLSKPTTPKCDEVKYDSFQSTNKPMKFKDAWLPKDEVQFEDTTRYNIIKDYEKKSQGAIDKSPKLPSYIEMPKPIQIEVTPSKPVENIVLKDRLYESFTIGKQKMCNVDHNTVIETQERKSYPTHDLETAYDKDSFSDFEKIVLKPKALSDKRPLLTKVQQQLPKKNVVSLYSNEKVESNTLLQAQKQLPKNNVIRLSEHIENKTSLQNSPKYLTSAEVLCDLENALGGVASGIVKKESFFPEDQQPSSSKPDQSEWIGYAYARETLDNIKDYVTLDQDGDPKKELIGVRRNFNKAMKRFNSAGPSFIWENVVSKSPGSGVGAEPSRKRSFSESSGESLDVAPKKSNSLVESISGYMSYDEDGCPKKEMFGLRRGLKRYAGYIGRSSERTVSSDGFSARPTQRLYNEARLVSNGSVKEPNMNQQSVDECSTDDDSFTNSSCLSMSDTHVKSCSSDFGEESGHSLSHSDISPMVSDSKPVSNTFEDIGEDIRLAARAFKSLVSDSNSDTSEHYNERIVSMISSQTVDV